MFPGRPMVDVKIDVKIQIPAVEKLLEYVMSSVEAISGLMLASRRARVTAATDKIEAQGEAEVRRIKALSHAETLGILVKAIAEAQTNSVEGEELQGYVELHGRSEIQTRLNFQEQKRASNIYRVIEAAIDSLNDRKVDNHEVDHDWAARFFADVQDITTESMQKIWAKILAGEVEKPGRTSLHTLAILKNMTQRDAELFSRASRFVFRDFIFWEKEHEQNIAGFPSFSEFLKLESYKLIKMSQFIREIVNASGDSKYNARIGNVLYKISATGEETDISIPSYSLTPQGEELYGFTGATLDPAYARALAKFVSGRGFRLEQARITEEIDSNKCRASPWEVIKFGES